MSNAGDKYKPFNQRSTSSGQAPVQWGAARTYKQDSDEEGGGDAGTVQGTGSEALREYMAVVTGSPYLHEANRAYVDKANQKGEYIILNEDGTKISSKVLKTQRQSQLLQRPHAEVRYNGLVAKSSEITKDRTEIRQNASQSSTADRGPDETLTQEEGQQGPIPRPRRP